MKCLILRVGSLCQLGGEIIQSNKVCVNWLKTFLNPYCCFITIIDGHGRILPQESQPFPLLSLACKDKRENRSGLECLTCTKSTEVAGGVRLLSSNPNPAPSGGQGAASDLCDILPVLARGLLPPLKHSRSPAATHENKLSLFSY